MTKAEDLIRREADRQGGREWAVALERFEGGYGDPPDFNDPHDRAAFLHLLRDEVARSMSRELATYIEQRTEAFNRAVGGET
jgi:hypothetical protein